MKRIITLVIILLPLAIHSRWYSVGLYTDNSIIGLSLRVVSNPGLGLHAVGNVYYPAMGGLHFIYQLRGEKFFFPNLRIRPYVGTGIIGGKDWDIFYTPANKFLGGIGVLGVEAVLFPSAPSSTPKKSPRGISTGLEAIYEVVPGKHAGLIVGGSIHYNW